MQTQFVNLLLIPIKISGRTTALSRQKVHLIIRIDFYRRASAATILKIPNDLRTGAIIAAIAAPHFRASAKR